MTLKSVSGFICEECGGPVIVKMYLTESGKRIRTTRDRQCRIFTSLDMDLAIKVLGA